MVITITIGVIKLTQAVDAIGGLLACIVDAGGSMDGWMAYIHICVSHGMAWKCCSVERQGHLW